MTHLEPEELSLGESDRIPGRPIFGYDSLFDLETGRGGESLLAPPAMQPDDMKSDMSRLCGSHKLKKKDCIENNYLIFQQVDRN